MKNNMGTERFVLTTLQTWFKKKENTRESISIKRKPKKAG